MSLATVPSAVRRSGRSSRNCGIYLVHPARPESLDGTHGRLTGEPATPLRLTRRGQAVARLGVALLVLVALLGGVLLLDRPAQAGSQAHPVPASYRIVLPGQTLWQIAGEVAPGVDRRTTVSRIVDLNALSTAAVYAGQRIAVPVG